MGMFDEIEFEMDCPGCGKKVSNFQSKDGPCNIEKLKPLDVNNFYSLCYFCDGWIQFTRVKPRDLNDFEMKFTPKEVTSDGR